MRLEVPEALVRELIAARVACELVEDTNAADGHRARLREQRAMMAVCELVRAAGGGGCSS